MTPNQNRVNRVIGKSIPLDLYEAGDQLAPNSYLAMRQGQTATHSDRPLPSDFQTCFKAGWTKPSIQLGALLYLQDRGDLNLNGRRRLHRLLVNISSLEITASLGHQEKISRFPERFEVLFRWATRDKPFRPYRRQERRRIGVGYRDKGSLPPSHQQGRNFGEQGLLYLGEEQEYLSFHPILSHLAGCLNGILLFQHVSDGWWRILSPYERYQLSSRMLKKALAKI